MSSAGLMTFHASHNFGSMLQAYATQRIIESWGYNCEIINFRMPSQKNYYSLYKSMKFGMVNSLGDIIMFPLHLKRKVAFQKFEAFMKNFYNLTSELDSYEELKRIGGKYDFYIAGSDQIWSKTIPEFLHSEVDFTDAFFLNFTEDNKKRISFATSTGEATLEDIEEKKELLQRFDCISVREEQGAEKLANVIGKRVPVVLDPTLLLNKEKWYEILNEERLIKEKYIFLYTLRGIRPGMKWGKNLYYFAKRNNLKIVCVSPFFPILFPGVKNIIDAGPLDFLNLIRYAEIVFTDSFHGTAFSLNFEKPFYSLVGKESKDNRKSGLLHLLGADDRCIAAHEDIQNISDFHMDYSHIEKNLEKERDKSLRILLGFMERSCREYM